MMFQTITIMLAIGFIQAGDPVSVDPGSSTPVDLSKTDLTNLFCQLKDKECAGNDLDKPVFAATARVCLALCGNNLKCLTAFYSKDKYCYLREHRCEESELKNSPGGTDLYRLKKGESCPASRPPFVDTAVKYSNKFCMAWGKKCPGLDLYPKPQNIAPYQECLKKCARISSCGSADVFGDKCSPKENKCREQDLVDDESYRNFERLEEGVNTCSGERTEPGDKKPPPHTEPHTEPVKPPTIIVPPAPKFCRREGLSCLSLFNNIEFIPFVFSFDRCIEYCAASDSCKSVYWGFEGSCWLKDGVCTNDQLVPWIGNDAVKISGSDCSPYEPTYEYCVRENRLCLFGDINIIPLTASLEKCQYYCNYNSRCKSVYFGYIDRTCLLKNKVCYGFFLSPAIGTDSVKEVDGAGC